MTLSISSDLERRIADQAAAAGYTSAEAYLRVLLSGTLSAASTTTVGDTEFVQLLDELVSDDLPTLPADFSRSDIYLDHN